jgi:hypothetical protein
MVPWQVLFPFSLFFYIVVDLLIWLLGVVEYSLGVVRMVWFSDLI